MERLTPGDIRSTPYVSEDEGFQNDSTASESDDGENDDDDGQTSNAELDDIGLNKLTLCPSFEDIVLGVSVEFWIKDEKQKEIAKFEYGMDEQMIVSSLTKKVIDEKRPICITFSKPDSGGSVIRDQAFIVVYLIMYVGRATSCRYGILAESYNLGNLDDLTRSMNEEMIEINKNNKRVRWDRDELQTETKRIRVIESFDLNETNDGKGNRDDDDESLAIEHKIVWKNSTSKPVIEVELTSECSSIPTYPTWRFDDLYLKIHFENEVLQRNLNTYIKEVYEQLSS